MGDRELLELAAKAAGIDCGFTLGSGDAMSIKTHSGGRIFWNPLADDGDAFRLASALRITVCHSELAVVVKHKQYSWEWIGEGVNEDTGDRNESARRAIVRAAVEIEKARGRE